MDLGTYANRGRKLLYAQTCTVQRSSGDASAYGSATNVHTNLNCSRVYELSDEEKEKGWMATTSRPLKIYTEMPSSGYIDQHDIVVVNSENYVVLKANRWPHSDPSYYELIVEYRRGQ